MKRLLIGLLALLPVLGYAESMPETYTPEAIAPIDLSEAEWQARLTPEQFRVLRKHGTERPFSSPLNNEKRHGHYHCVACQLPLFDSTDKFESGTGWPSFTQLIHASHVTEHKDYKIIWPRTEIRCARCDGHLGHVFPDGPTVRNEAAGQTFAPTGLRYCMNGVVMGFTPMNASATEVHDASHHGHH